MMAKRINFSHKMEQKAEYGMQAGHLRSLVEHHNGSWVNTHPSLMDSPPALLDFETLSLVNPSRGSNVKMNDEAVWATAQSNQ